MAEERILVGLLPLALLNQMRLHLRQLIVLLINKSQHALIRPSCVNPFIIIK